MRKELENKQTQSATRILSIKMNKALFNDDNNSDNDISFKTSKDYAKQYQKQRQKEVLQSCTYFFNFSCLYSNNI